MSAGFLYVLINPTMPGLSKVGKTTRDPNQRIAELSAVTGVASPFILAYQQPVLNCDAAERWVHHMLSEKGHRHASNREFFNAPLHEIIPLLLQSADIPSDKIGKGEDGNTPATHRAEDIAEALFQEGCAYLHGDGAVVRDPRRALGYFEQAAVLGHVRASREVAFRYEHGKSVEGGPNKDAAKALSYLARLVSGGEWTAHADIAKLFARAGQPGSAQEHWKRFFDGAFKDRQHRQRSGNGLDSTRDREIAKNGWNYCDQVAKRCIEQCVEPARLKVFASEICDFISQYRSYVRENPSENSYAMLTRLNNAYDLLQ